MSAPGILTNIELNTEAAFQDLYDLLDSENPLEAADTQALAAISNAEANSSTAFEQEMNAPATGADGKDLAGTNYLTQLQYLANEANPPTNQAILMQQLETDYNDTNAQNQQVLQVENSQIQMEQGVLGQIPQTQQAVINGFQGIIQLQANLAHLMSGTLV